MDVRDFIKSLAWGNKNIKEKQNPNAQNWNLCLMGMAEELAKKSKDPSSQVGCVMVDENYHPISFGLNGWISGCEEELMTYERTPEYPMKYLGVCHAEMNALLFANRPIAPGFKVYTTHAPCANCLKYLCQKKPAEIWYKNSDPTVKRGTLNDKEVLLRLLFSMSESDKEDNQNMQVRNIVTNEFYHDEIWESESSETWKKQADLSRSVHSKGNQT